jgi:hypothetical protein
MICSSVCLFRLIVWSFPQGQTPVHPGSIQGGNVTILGGICGAQVTEYEFRNLIGAAKQVIGEFGGRFVWRGTLVHQFSPKLRMNAHAPVRMDFPSGGGWECLTSTR